MNAILMCDIKDLVSQRQYFEPFENSSILVTGATGLIGSILVKSLVEYSRKNESNITVYAACRNEAKYSKVFADYKTESLKPVFSDIFDLDISALSVDYIVHGASITDSKTFIQKPVETIDTAIDGTRNLLKQCIHKPLKGFVYLSSLEIYGISKDFAGIRNVKEEDAGYIDCMSVRASYSEGKRMVENICASYATEYFVPVKVVRLCQTFGAGVEYNDNRVFAQFARSVIEGENIVLKTRGETVRNYCYTTDAVSAILTVLAKGNAGEAYNIANMTTTISIADMAQFVCTLYPESGSKVVFDISEDAGKLGYNSVVQLQLDSAKVASLGWKPCINLEAAFRKLIEGMRMDR